VIYNVPQDINVENLEESILTQNPELGLIQGDIVSKFSYRSKRGLINMVTEVCSGTRKKLLRTKLKLGWLICSTDDCLLARRSFKCSRFNHRHEDCRGDETCPLCAGGHKLKECTAPATHYKCINCVCKYVCVCMYVCMSMYVCMYLYVCVSVYVGMYVCMCVYVCMYVLICMCECLCRYVCMYVCLCMYVCMYLYVCVSVYVCIYACMYVCTYVCTYVYMYVCTLSMYVCACMHVCIVVCMYVCVYGCMYAYVCMFAVTDSATG